MKSVVVLTVNTFSVEPGRGEPGSLAIETKHPLLLGGVSRFARNHFATPPEQFVGCIKNVLISKKEQKIDLSKAVGNVTVSACPTI